MSQMVIVNIEESVKAALRTQAALHGRSMEEEAGDILRAAVVKKAESSQGFGTWVRGLVEAAGGGIDIEIPELRGEQLRPVDFDKE